MEGASRRAFAQLRDELLRRGASTQLAAELRDVAALLASQPGLRRGLTEPSRPVEARHDLARQLLGSRVSEEAMAVIATAVAQRWRTSADLVSALELLAVGAEMVTADNDGTLGEIEDELFRFTQIVRANPALASALSDRRAPAGQRADLVASLLDGKAHPATVRLITAALGGLGGRGLDASLEYLIEAAADQRDRHVAYVTTASPLTAEQEQQLAEQLSAIYGRAIAVMADVDPSMLGGATVRIGADRYDGSIARALQRARIELTKK